MEIELCQESSSNVVDRGESSNVVDRGQREMEIKSCGEIPCGLFDTETVLKDLKERNMSKRKLIVAILLCSIFMVVEYVGGIKAHSLALLTDAAHLIVDVVCFAISIFSLYASGRKATPRLSYGYFRIEILANLVSILLLSGFTGWIVHEAITRLNHKKRETKGSLMFGVASFGLIVNFAMVFLFGHHDHHNQEEDGGSTEVLVNNGTSVGEEAKNINVQGAYLHAITDFWKNHMYRGEAIWHSDGDSSKKDRLY